jgi:DNA-directed RNA polymerase subunit K/omega
MQVFHGSNVRIEKIDLAKSEFFKDFGRGFYVTNIREHAYLRAVDVSKKRKTDKPIVTEFKYMEAYPVTVGMNVKKFENVSKEWVEFIMLNRNRQISHPAHTFDIVEGPIADDRMVIQIRKYEQGKISIEKLIEKLTYREPTYQICFCTLAALYALELVDESEFRSATDNITETILETMVVDFKMTESTAIKTFYSSKSYESLSNADTLFWQKSWQEIYNILREELAI